MKLGHSMQNSNSNANSATVLESASNTMENWPGNTIQNKYHHKLSKVQFFKGSSNLGFRILKLENRVKKL